MKGPLTKRSLLAVYVDLLVFGAAWSPLAYGLRAYVPGLDTWYVALIAFALFEAALLRTFGASPGRWALGMRAAAQGEAVGGRWAVCERWWTMLVGVLGLMEGSKEAVRFTQGLPPPPFMGLALTWDAAAAVVTITGWAYIVAGLGVLRCRSQGAVLGMMISATSLASWLSSWAQIPAWVEARTVARRALQGVAVRPGEIALMQKVLPLGALVAALVGGVWLFFVWRRFRACHPERRT